MKSNTLVFILFTLVVLSSQSDCPFAGTQSGCSLCQGYYFYDGGCRPCTNASSEYTCELCHGYYFMNSKCNSCAEFANPGTCLECPGFFFSNGECISCALASPYMCSLQCPDYFLNKGRCTRCTAATDSLTCKYCEGNFQFKNSSCVQCPKHFLSFATEYQCLSCEGLTLQLFCDNCDQFYFYNSTCSACRNSTSLTTCKLCPGFYFSEGQCAHCNNANESQCLNCQNYVFENGFCIPCKIISNPQTCLRCARFRFSTNRGLCVPCQKSGYFLTESNICESCYNSTTKAICQTCPSFMYDKLASRCYNCSQTRDLLQCLGCSNYYFDNGKCSPCINASIENCLIFCEAHFFQGSCKRCEEAQSKRQCQSCIDRQYYWSKSNRCMRCLINDFYQTNGQCRSCESASTDFECFKCPFYIFTNGKCLPFKLANSSIDCKKSRLNVYFSNKSLCQLCELASNSQCQQENCPGYQFWNSTCKHAEQITDISACVKNTYFSFSKGSCRYCQRQGEYLNPITKMCFKCQGFTNSGSCSRCPKYYFDQLKQACVSCSSSNKSNCALCPSYLFVKNSCKSCDSFTEKNNCKQCPNYYYNWGQCSKCQDATTFEECRMCKNFAFENGACVRCSSIMSPTTCEQQCSAYNYYSIPSVNLCLTCQTANSSTYCSLCTSYTWNTTLSKCYNCNSSQSICSTCLRMVWYQGRCAQCLTPNCANCNLIAICNLCMPSFELSPDNLTCVKVCNVQYCGRCTSDSSSLCSECLPDYTFVGKNAICKIDCQVFRCLTCSSNSVCQTCSPGYVLKDNGASCICKLDGCDTCQVAKNLFVISTNSTTQRFVCKYCLNGFALNNQTKLCQRINCNISNCEICSSSNACSLCEKGLKLLNKKCVPICNITNCKSCLSKTTCNQCIKGYQLLSGKCQMTCGVPNCKTCINSTSCTVCSKGYVLNSSKSICQRKCSQQSYYKQDHCERCQKSLIGCSKCSFQNQALQCQKCLVSHVQMFGQCISCQSIIHKCSSCDFDQYTTKFNCNSCLFGYSLIDNRCRKCADNCLKCEQEGQGDCDVCSDGYVYNLEDNFDIKCIPCLNNCSMCAFNDLKLCLSCHKGYFLNNKQCQICPLFCDVCTNQSSCISCIHGYSLQNNKCVLITIPNCLSLNELNQCVRCEIGYLISEKQCRIDVSCSVNASCIKCPQLYYPSLGKCLACPKIENCQRCNSKMPQLCISCQKGYFLAVNNSCISCMQGCRVCQSYYLCSQAQSKYYIEESTHLAVPCPNSCKACKSPILCQSCEADYVLISTQCVRNDSINYELVVQPKSHSWDNLTSHEKERDLMNNWLYYTDEVNKIVGYADRPHLVIIKSASVGSIKFNLVIKVLPTEEHEKVISRIEANLKKQNSYFNLISSSRIALAQPKIEGSLQNFENCGLIMISAAIIGTIAMFGLVIVACIIVWKRCRNNKINPQDTAQPSKVNRDGTSNKFSIKSEEQSSDTNKTKAAKCDKHQDQQSN